MQRRYDWVLALGALVGFGCSGPVPAAVAVGLDLNLPQTNCGITGAQSPDDLGNPPPSLTSPGKRAYDGDDGVSASCSVKGSGPWQIFARVSSSNPRVTFIVSDGTIDADGKGTARISVSTQATDAIYSTPDGGTCTLTAAGSKAAGAANNAPQVKPGGVWAGFDCRNLTKSPSGICSATGTFVFEHCEE